MSFRASILTLYPDMFPGTLGQALAGKALDQGTWSLDVTQIRDFAADRHRSVDDTPAGGGPGMVMRADVLARAIDHASPADDPRPRLLMSPRGRPFDQALARGLAARPGAVIVCGRFEGVDERVIEARGLTEISIGDYVLSGGEVAAQVVLDAVVRLLPGVMGNQASADTESFEAGLLEHPHFTRPTTWEGRTIPDVLTSGNHAKIAAWRRDQAETLTRQRRPDLAGVASVLTAADKANLEQLETSLWIAETRFDNAYMSAIFAPDFREYGCSGRRYARDEMLFGTGAPKKILARLPLPDLQMHTFDASVVQLTYVSEMRIGATTQRCNRSSIWSRGGKHGWFLRFHQGTPVFEPETDA